MKRVSWLLFLCALFSVFASPGWGATTYTVTKNGTGADENITVTGGSSSAPTLSALVTAAADGDIIEVGAGTYTLTDTLKPTKKITLKAADSSNKPTLTLGTPANGSVIVLSSDAAGDVAGTTIDGFKIIAGAGSNLGGSSVKLGGGIGITVPSATIQNCEFDTSKPTTVVYGTGLAIRIGTATTEKGTITVKGCQFTGNVGDAKGPGTGIFAQMGTSSVNAVEAELIVEDCTFTKNSANSGGGIYFHSMSSTKKAELTVRNCLFDGNVANETTSASGSYGGGGINLRDSPLYNITANIENCTFKDNTASGGSGISIVTVTTESGTNSSLTSSFAIKNCTFLGNKVNKTTDSDNHGAHGYGGAIAVWNTNNVAVTNCTFVGNGFADNITGNGAEVGISSVSSKTSEVTLINCIIANSTAKSLYIPTNSKMTLKNCAYNSSAVDGTITNGDGNIASINWSSRTSEKAKVNGVEHSVFKLTASDTALATAGTATGAPKTDQLGVTRSTSKPSIGAVEYVTLAVSTTTLPAGTVGTAYSEKLSAAFTPEQSDAELKWDLKSGSTLPSGLSLDIGGVISGTPTTANTYSFTLTVTGSGDLYSNYSADQAFSLTINPKPDVSFDIGTVKITSTGGSKDINIELASADYSDSAKTSSSDLTSVSSDTLTVASSDQADVVVTIATGDGEIEAVLFGNAPVTLSDKKFTPSAAGTYKIIFKGTDDNDNEKYFAAEFRYSIIDDSALGSKVSSDDVTGTPGNYKIREDIGKIQSPFTNNSGSALLSIVNDFFSATTTTPKNLATAAEMSKVLEAMGNTADDVGDETSGYKIIGAKLNRTVPAMVPFLVILKGTDDAIYVGIGVTQAESDILVIKFELLQDAEDVAKAFLFPRGRYTVGATNSSEYLNSAEDEEPETIKSVKSVKSASVIFMSADDTDTIEDLSFGELELAGTAEEDVEGSSKGSSSGCDTGAFGIAALLAVLAFTRKKMF